MSTGDETTIGRLYLVSLADINVAGKTSNTYHVKTGAETAFGLIVSYLLAVGVQIPDLDVSILANASKILTILGQCNGPNFTILS